MSHDLPDPLLGRLPMAKPEEDGTCIKNLLVLNLPKNRAYSVLSDRFRDNQLFDDPDLGLEYTQIVILRHGLGYLMQCKNRF